MLKHEASFFPMICSLADDFQTLRTHIRHCFRLYGMPTLYVVFTFAGPELHHHSFIFSDMNTSAMLRMMRARGGVDLLQVVPARNGQGNDGP